ncbi:DUF4198 domain-containing protein [Olivibacter sp. XZL3]|uniref:DUF4198 domain-containing protein n=1 Tax=Olivibacter sp. XZL3 TaxID=1735116 RepID=UPI00106703F1|nr:DUF4198 domain-containing protein [Olivibacter sp. XZL3]
MKTLKFTLLVGLCFFVSVQAKAHALWIETASQGKLGVAHDVKIFYGEFALNERDALEKWYSDVRDFTLWIVAPDGKKSQLKAVPEQAYYSGSFTPEKEGVYTLMVSHEAADLGGTTKYHFISSAYVSVGKSNKVDANLNDNALKLYADNHQVFAKNKPVKLFAYLNGKPLANKPVNVASPEGWSKEVMTDENGMLSFQPLWSGRYVAEAQNFEKVGGNHKGKDFDAAWIGSTFSFEVK